MNAVSMWKRAMSASGRFFVASVVLGAVVGCGNAGGGTTGSGGGGGTTVGTPLASGGATDIYVTQSSLSGELLSVLDFAADTNGNVSAKGTIVPPTSFQFESLATDSLGELYVGSAATDPNGNPFYEVLVYAPGASGQATPVRTIHLLANPSGTFLPLQMTVTPAGKLYVVSPLAVGVFAANVDGDGVAESSFSLPGGSQPTGIAADAAGNIYVAGATSGNTTTGQILVYAAGANGTVAPTQTITTQGIPYGVTVDGSGNVYTSVNAGTLNGGVGSASTNALVEYGGLMSGSLAVIKTIAGSATGVTFATGPEIDAAGNLYVVSEATKGSGSTFSETSEIVGFASTATGNVAPGVVLSSSDWTEAGTQLALH